ncbi:MAG: hypothetical protein EON92_20485 [Burkholderiales bacterium]|nr:MAG: hypothetical protein EON92_20485 [Burkholderiales bacterium]
MGELAGALGIPERWPGADAPGGVYTFSANEMPVQLTLYEDTKTLLMAAVALEEDISSQPQAALALLRHAHLGEQTMRCGVSVSAGGRPVVWHWLPTTSIDATQLENSLGGFVATAGTIRQMLMDAMKAVHREALEAPVPAPLSAPLGALRA